VGRKIKATDARTGKPIEVDAESIKSGPIRSRSLPDPLLRRVKAVHARLKGMYNVNLEQFEIGFMRESPLKGRSPSGNASPRPPGHELGNRQVFRLAPLPSVIPRKPLIKL
jgi:hypothetical protein